MIVDSEDGVCREPVRPCRIARCRTGTACPSTMNGCAAWSAAIRRIESLAIWLALVHSNRRTQAGEFIVRSCVAWQAFIVDSWRTRQAGPHTRPDDRCRRQGLSRRPYKEVTSTDSMRILLVEDEPSAAQFIARGLREARHAAGSDVPVLMLTARDAVESRVRALTRPKSAPALARAHRSPSPGHRRPRAARLPPSPSMSGTSITTRSRMSIDVYVQRLRRKLDEGDEPSLIRTRRGQGYQLL